MILLLVSRRPGDNDSYLCFGALSSKEYKCINMRQLPDPRSVPRASASEIEDRDSRNG